jgi:hypothetical protein
MAKTGLGIMGSLYVSLSLVQKHCGGDSTNDNIKNMHIHMM